MDTQAVSTICTGVALHFYRSVENDLYGRSTHHRDRSLCDAPPVHSSGAGDAPRIHTPICIGRHRHLCGNSIQITQLARTSHFYERHTQMYWRSCISHLYWRRSRGHVHTLRDPTLLSPPQRNSASMSLSASIWSRESSAEPQLFGREGASALLWEEPPVSSVGASSSSRSRDSAASGVCGETGRRRPLIITTQWFVWRQGEVGSNALRSRASRAIGSLYGGAAVICMGAQHDGDHLQGEIAGKRAPSSCGVVQTSQRSA